MTKLEFGCAKVNFGIPQTKITMRKIEQLLEEYGDSHRNPLNKTIHWICVPTIFFCVVALIWSIPAGFLQSFSVSTYANWATVALILVMIYYLTLSVMLSLGMLLFASACLWLAGYLEAELVWPLWQFALGLFVLAWIGQFYGHHVEGKKPSFFKDLQFLLIGPAWLMHFIYRRIGIPY